MCIQVTSDVACLETYKNIKPLNLQPLVSHRRIFPHQAELRLHWSISLASAVSTVSSSQKRFLDSTSPDTPVLEENLSRDSVKFCVLFKGFVWATWGSDMKIVIEFARNVFYSSEKSGNLGTNAKKKLLKRYPRPSTVYPRPSTWPSTKTYIRKPVIFLNQPTKKESWRSNGFLKGHS